MEHIPKGYWIENPYNLLQTDFIISDSILHILKTSDRSVFFTRLSIKHLAEKGDSGKYILYKMKEILEAPDSIYTGNFENRFLILKKIEFENDSKPHIVTLEVTKDSDNIIVTGFIARNTYFKNLEKFQTLKLSKQVNSSVRKYMFRNMHFTHTTSLISIYSESLMSTVLPLLNQQQWNLTFVSNIAPNLLSYKRHERVCHG